MLVFRYNYMYKYFQLPGKLYEIIIPVLYEKLLESTSVYTRKTLDLEINQKKITSTLYRSH